jgi:zinc D-Ala-D-Ala carboxypeptidase
MNVSKYITLAEATKSQQAIRAGISNKPNDAVMKNMQHVATEIFDKVRDHFGVPIGISSFYRSSAINRLVGGAKNSQHVQGEAIDIDADIFGIVTNQEIFEYIKANLVFDQLIWEYGNDEQPAWVHVSLKRDGKNRKQVLKIK